jgi:hypothetical protein
VSLGEQSAVISVEAIGRDEVNLGGPTNICVGIFRNYWEWFPQNFDASRLYPPARFAFCLDWSHHQQPSIG